MPPRRSFLTDTAFRSFVLRLEVLYIRGRTMTSRAEKRTQSSKDLKAQFESKLVGRFGEAVVQRDKPSSEFTTTGLAELDGLTGGLPRGATTEILGPASSGRTSLMLSIIAAANAREEVSALVDATDSLDARCAAQAGVDLYRLLWVRCGGNVENALKATDLLLQGGGFGLVVLDLGDISTQQAKKIQATWWYRFRRAIENTTTCLVVIERERNSHSSASLSLELHRQTARWSVASRVAEKSSSYGDQRQNIPLTSTLLSGFTLTATRNKPIRPGQRETKIESVSDE